MTASSDVPFPSITPTARAYNPGDWPVRSFVSQSGVEMRIMYGDMETGTGLSLTFSNLPDAEAELFVDHYRTVLGTYMSFPVDNSGTGGIRGGWEGSSSAIGAPAGNQWRYASAPTLRQVGPGISSVNVDLVAVL